MILFYYSYMINILVAGMIISKIVFTCVVPASHHPAYSWVTWALAVACSALIVWIFQGHLRLAELAQTVINLLFCMALFSADGDVASLIKGRGYTSVI
ncbi:phage holin family protein [Pseudescherichia sp.]|uniref:phage holin family protein n=1 Tax=Pseudescherichia sp. TaxID=2055881 RepID=UPI00289C9A58|nr:phage holin family protein [Pseudescherichia sp.]